MKKYSLWLENIQKIECPKISKNMNVDVLIAGGGITGLSTLYQLKDSGLKTILVERNKCGYGVTSRSTAKITYLQEKIYMNIRKYVGEDWASLYLKSQREAVNLLVDIINKEKINCDLTKVSSYLYTCEDKNIQKINDEYLFLKNNSVMVEKLKRVPLVKNVKLALKVDDTYMFHPLKYINHLKKTMWENIFESSKLENIQKIDDYYECKVNNFIVKAKYVVMATHYPYFLLPFAMPLKNHIETSFIGAKKSKFTSVSAINVDKPTVSFRFHFDGSNDYEIFLFNSLGTANIKNLKSYFNDLESQDKFQYVWSNKDIITNDFIPFIGRISDNLFLATGFNTWGMTNGTIAGKIIKDLITKNESEYEKIFNPNRSINLAKVINFPLNMLSNVKAMLKSTKNNVNNNKVIYTKIKGKKVAVYTDDQGIKHIVYNKCPHMKCGLIFNEVEKTWDCLCHGSRFTIDGKCIEGPSNFDISFK